MSSAPFAKPVTSLRRAEASVAPTGDLVAILTAGAYGFVPASNYNSRPRPCELLVDGTGFISPETRDTMKT